MGYSNPNRGEGTLHPRAKITPEQGVEIYQRSLAGESGKVLAAEYGVSSPVISKIRRGLHPTTRHLALLPRKRGDAHHNAAITAEQGQEIQERLWLGATIKDLAAEYGLSVVTVSQISTGVHWTVREERIPDWLSASYAATLIGVTSEAVVEWVRKEWIHGIEVASDGNRNCIVAVPAREVLRARAQYNGPGSMRPK